MILRECYERIERLVENVDALDVVEEVERYRRFWKPKNVKIVLLAESHVRTSHQDFVHRWSFVSSLSYQGCFVRFVYCLANGEKNLERHVEPDRPSRPVPTPFFLSCCASAS